MHLGYLFVCKCTVDIFLFSPAETEPHEGKRKVESLWPIFRLHHQRSRYIFDLFYKRKAISRGIDNNKQSCMYYLVCVCVYIYMCVCIYNCCRQQQCPKRLEMLTHVSFSFGSFRAVWLLHQGRLCRQKPYCQMEEAGLWESVLPSLHSDTRHQLWNQLHLQSPQEQAGSGELGAFCREGRLALVTGWYGREKTGQRRILPNIYFDNVVKAAGVLLRRPP